jgi:hypothetical protein
MVLSISGVSGMLCSLFWVDWLGLQGPQTVRVCAFHVVIM